MALGWLTDLISGVAGDLYSSLPDEIRGLYVDDEGNYVNLPQLTAPDISFQPFTVSSGFGGITAGPEGTQYTLSPQQQAIQDALMRNALGRFTGSVPGADQMGAAGLQMLASGQGLMGQTPFGLGGMQDASTQAYGLGQQYMTEAGMPIGQRETDVYERIRAMQTPEEGRQQMALEERLARQGRLGVQTAQFGATPEQLALAKAQTESQNQAAFQAMQQAQAERAQAAGLGSQFASLGAGMAGQSQALQAAQQAQALAALTGGQGLLAGQLGLEGAQQQLGTSALQAGYAPQAALLSAFSPALNVASLADVARRQQGEFGMEAELANLQALIGQRAGLASLYGGMFSGATGLLGGIGNAATDILTALFGGD